jgi:hypothetical protein
MNFISNINFKFDRENNMQIKKIKTFLILTIVAVLIFPTTLVSATETVGNNGNSSYEEFGINKNRSDKNYTAPNGLRFILHTDRNTATVTGYSYMGQEGRVLNIPGTLNVEGRVYIVDAINDFALADRNLTSVSIPEHISRIGRGALATNSLTEVKLPNSLTTIESNVLANNQLISVFIPNSVMSIKDGAFEYNNLTSISIPNSVTSIGAAAFNRNKLTSVTLPNSLTTIEDQVFWGNELTTVSIPPSVRSIGVMAFDSNRLTSVEIPNSVTSIGVSAFYNNQLTSIRIPNSLNRLERSVFGNNQLTNVVIPYSVTTIENDAFFSNNIATAFIPNSVTSIGNAVFSVNPLQYIHTDDGNADNLKSMLTNMGSISENFTMLLERSPTRYESDVEMVNNVFTGNDLQFRTISQIKHVYNNNSRTWSTHVPVVQWYRNGSPIAGETNATLTLSNIQASDAGGYHAVVDSTVLENITVNVTVVYPISELFPDANLAKAIAEELHKNEDTSALVSLEDLATIENINLNGKGIQDLTGIEHLINVLSLNLNNNEIQNVNPLSNLNRLQFLLLNNNQIGDISSLLALTNLFVLEAQNQTITLPEGKCGEPIELQLINRDGSTPAITFVEGQGTYENGKLIWTTAGENRLTWSGPQFSGTVTQSVIEIGVPISTFFPDENLAKAIAQVLNSNNDISALTTETELATISILNIPNMGIKDLTGVDHLKNLVMINAGQNHIHDIRIISKLPNIVMYSFLNQTIQLPEGARGEPTDIQLVGKDGFTPLITFIKGRGTYENGKLTWTTSGENQLTWQEGNFSGTLTQNVKDIGSPIFCFFPDENLAKEIALSLNNNQDITALTTEEELSKISALFIPQKGIKDLTGIDYLKNLSIINAPGNHISDIRVISKLPNIMMYNFANQTIQLPEVIRGESTDIPLVNINGTTPSISYVKGEGTYVDGKLTWSSVGENQLTWQGPQFSGTLTQTTISEGQTIASLFPDENLAKEIAQQLHGNQNTSVYVTEDELLDIDFLIISNKGIKNLSGIENLRNLMGLNISHNHIHDISMLSDLPNLMIVMASGQTITLPEVTVGTSTKLTIRNEKGETPNYTFTVGQGTYVDGELRWTTAGENQLTWSSLSSWGSFDGKVIQNVIQSKQTIASMFPDANFAQSIAMELHGNTDTSVEVTEQDLKRITQLTIPNRNIRSISGIENLQNLMFISAEGNQITDISMLSKLPKLITFYMPKQSVILSDVVTGTPTPLTLLNHNAIVPQYEFTVGKGSYNNGMLTWITAGENKLNWTHNAQSDGFFDGTIIQSVF